MPLRPKIIRGMILKKGGKEWTFFFRKMEPEKDSTYRQGLNSILVIAMLIDIVNSLFLNWQWVYITMIAVMAVVAILIFKEYQGEK